MQLRRPVSLAPSTVHIHTTPASVARMHHDVTTFLFDQIWRNGSLVIHSCSSVGVKNDLTLIGAVTPPVYCTPMSSITSRPHEVIPWLFTVRRHFEEARVRLSAFLTFYLLSLQALAMSLKPGHLQPLPLSLVLALSLRLPNYLFLLGNLLQRTVKAYLQ